MEDRAGATTKPKQVIESTEVSDRQLRYWAEIGLVKPAAVTPGRQARYGPRDVRRVRLINAMLEGGATLGIVKVVIDACANECEKMLGKAVSDLLDQTRHFAGDNAINFEIPRGLS